MDFSSACCGIPHEVAATKAVMTQQDLQSHDKILIVDFGSQVTQLIARRVREEKVYCEIVPFQNAESAFREMRPKGVILSGGPASVLDKDAPLAPPSIYQAGRAGARHLLRRAGHGGAARRQSRGRPSSRIRPRRGRGDDAVGADRRRLGSRPEISGVDEPRRPRHRAAGRLCRRRHLGQRADRHDRRRQAQILRHAIPSRSHAHPARRRAPAQFRAQGRGLHRRLDHARVQAGGDRQDPQAGRQGQGDLRTVRRRRFRRGRGAHPRSDRRAAHLRLRRSWAASPRRSRKCRGAVPRPLQYPARSMSTPPTRSSRRSKASTIRKPNAKPSANCSSTCSRPKRRKSAAPSSSPKARSIPT